MTSVTVVQAQKRVKVRYKYCSRQDVTIKDRILCFLYGFSFWFLLLFFSFDYLYSYCPEVPFKPSAPEVYIKANPSDSMC